MNKVEVNLSAMHLGGREEEGTVLCDIEARLARNL